RITAFCLMPNHYHLLLQTPDGNLSRFMRHVDGVYTQRFNRAHKLDGSLFRGRYKAVVVEADRYLLQLVRYIHRNPVRAGLVERVDRYRWSSDHEYRSGSRHWAWLDKSFVLSVLGKARENQVRAYRQFMSEPDSDELGSLFARERIPSLLGSETFIDRLKVRLRNLADHPEIPESKVLSPGIDSIRKAVSAAYKIDGSDLLSSRRGTTNEARNVAVYLCRRLSGETLAGIAREFHLSNYGSVSSLVSRMKKTLTDDARLRKRVERLEQQLRKAQNQT
ncbi:MAG: helix-turn-helix domain-containing protein, partial [Desulfomonilaceae bacterium]|nr:helix-turn-helix domain-containing protein [Desulfomonilaceae bacterium]